MMHRRTATLALVLGAALSGCATYQPVPQGYSGPTATIHDSGFSEDSTKAQFFAVVAVNGQSISNAFGDSTQASAGRGAQLRTIYTYRDVKAEPMKLTLRGSHATGAPIHAMASQMAGTFFTVEGVVDFTPQAGATYVVKGELSKAQSSVWIEDMATKQKVSAVIRR